MRLSFATIFALAKDGDSQAEEARKAWLALVPFVIAGLTSVQAWARPGKVEVGLTWSEK